MRFVRRDVDLDHRDFGKSFPCPDCVKKAEPITFFQGLEIKDDNRKVIERAIDMAINPVGWLVLVGPIGTGKTTLLKAIMSAWMGQPTEPLTAVGMLDIWRGGMDSGEFLATYNRMMTSRVFGIDDLGVPNTTDWTVERMSELLNHRYERRLPTVITTDLDEDKMAAHFGARIADRVFDQKTGVGHVMWMGGDSRRTGRLWQQ